LLPVFIIFFIGAIAETNRAPFDLAEAESELVSGFMTEHSASVFVFFFLAEYASIVLICIFTVILFLGGYLPFSHYDILNFVTEAFNALSANDEGSVINFLYIVFNGLGSALFIGIKASILIFTFI